MGNFKDVLFCKVDMSKEPDYEHMIMTMFHWSNSDPKH